MLQKLTSSNSISWSIDSKDNCTFLSSGWRMRQRGFLSFGRQQIQYLNFRIGFGRKWQNIIWVNCPDVKSKTWRDMKKLSANFKKKHFSLPLSQNRWSQACMKVKITKSQEHLSSHFMNLRKHNEGNHGPNIIMKKISVWGLETNGFLDIS